MTHPKGARRRPLPSALNTLLHGPGTACQHDSKKQLTTTPRGPRMERGTGPTDSPPWSRQLPAPWLGTTNNIRRQVSPSRYEEHNLPSAQTPVEGRSLVSCKEHRWRHWVLPQAALARGNHRSMVRTREAIPVFIVHGTCVSVHHCHGERPCSLQWYDPDIRAALGLAFRLPLVDWFWLCLGVEPNPKVEPRTTPQKRGHRHAATVPPCRKAPGVFEGRLSVVRTRYPGKCGLDG